MNSSASPPDESGRGDTTRIESCLEKLDADPDGAFNELAPLIYDRYRRLAARILNEDFPDLHGQTDDAYQDALAKLQVALRSEKVDPRTKQDLYGLVRLQIKRALLNLVNRYRRDEHHLRIDAARESEQRQIDLAAERPMPDPTEIDPWLKLQECLEQLDPELREVVEYRLYVGLTHQEIADVLALPITTVQWRWRAARDKLKRAGDNWLPE